MNSTPSERWKPTTGFNFHLKLMLEVKISVTVTSIQHKISVSAVDDDRAVDHDEKVASNRKRKNYTQKSSTCD